MPSRDDAARGWALRPATRPEAGGGHVSRCAALGVALAAHGPVTAIVEQDGGSWIGRFRDAGFDVVEESKLGDRGWRCAVLDDYGLQANDIARWRKHVAGPLVQVVDHQSPLPGINLAINATAGRSGDRLNGVPALLGASYAMLAAPYRDRPKPEIKPAVARVLVSVGWIDPQGVTERVLAALAHACGPQTHVDVMLSSTSPNIGQVAAIIGGKPNWRLHRDVKEPSLLLEGIDLAVSAAGQGLLERLAFGIPTMAMAVADNQEPALSGVIAADAAFNLGRFAELSEDKIASDYAALAADMALRAKLSAAAQRLVDGRGAQRVARHLLAISRMRRTAEVAR